MKKLLKSLMLTVLRFRHSITVRRYDSAGERVAVPDTELYCSGFRVDDIDSLLSVDGLTKKMQASDLRRSPDSSTNSYTSWVVPLFLWEALLNSEHLREIVAGYLGPNARLDDLYVKTVRSGVDSISEGWHTDGVGYRLKMFMVFDTDGVPSSTLVVPQRRPNLYSISVTDEFARFYKGRSTAAKPNAKKIDYKPGTVLLLDTNTLHRGDYSSDLGTRYCVVCEFIDRAKANEIRGFSPCGPRQARGKLEIPLTYDALKAHSLIDVDLLEPAGQACLYGY